MTTDWPYVGVGLALFAVRNLIPSHKWPDKLALISSRSLKIGQAWMVFATLLPLEVLPLYHSGGEGCCEARSRRYLTTPDNALLEWARSRVM